jgi:hypothetical protein
LVDLASTDSVAWADFEGLMSEVVLVGGGVVTGGVVLVVDVVVTGGVVVVVDVVVTGGVVVVVVDASVVGVTTGLIVNDRVAEMAMSGTDVSENVADVEYPPGTDGVPVILPVDATSIISSCIPELVWRRGQHLLIIDLRSRLTWAFVR